MRQFCALLFFLCVCLLPGCKSGPSTEDKAYVAAFTRAAEELQKSRRSPEGFSANEIGDRLQELSAIRTQYQQTSVPSRFSKADSLLRAAIAEQEAAFQVFQDQIKNYTEEKKERSKEHWKKAYDLMEESIQSARDAGATEVEAAMKKLTP